jgi:glycosyltransferase involved in cell wall biosynthesis
MQNPLISVVMVVCNADRFLAEAIESILSQTFSEFEFIIVDFGSTDKSRSIISSYATRDRRVKFHTMSNCALPEARNAGCFLAQGQYIAIMDADDVSVRDRLKWEFEFMEEHPESTQQAGRCVSITCRLRTTKSEQPSKVAVRFVNPRCSSAEKLSPLLVDIASCLPKLRTMTCG